MSDLIFIVFSFFSLFFSIFVIISKNPVHSILSLILVFFNAASLLIFLNVDFLALLFIIVYVGAVAVLFLFVIMLLNIKTTNLNLSVYRYLPILSLLILIFFFELFFGFSDFDNQILNYTELNLHQFWFSYIKSTNSIFSIGLVLYTYYSYYFVFSGIILLLSMVGAITLTLHKRNDVKKQFIHKQIQRDFISSLSWKN